MPRKGVTIYDLLISCPGDILEELEIIRKTITNFNRMFGQAFNIEINLKHWSTDGFPQSGGEPQALLNEQFINDCDAAIAVFWTRFGTPTDRYQSGTEEEIEEMIKSGKQVFLYFSDKPVSPSQVDREQYDKIANFKEKYKEKGLYWTFPNTEEFEKLLLNHITSYFLNIVSENDNVTERITSSQLVLRGVHNNTISEDLHITNKNWINSQFILELKEDIKRSYENIFLIKVPEKLIEDHESTVSELPPTSDMQKTLKELQNTLSKNFNRFTPIREDVSISGTVEETLCKYAQNEGISLPKDFFYLGNLKKSVSSFSTDLMGYTKPSYEGTDEEKSKYKDINSLYFDVLRYNQYIEYFSQFINKKVGICVVSNIGNSYDEDIDINLIIPKNTIYRASDFNLPGSEIIKSINYNKIYSYMFSMPNEAYVEKFSNYPIAVTRLKTYLPSNPFIGKSSKEEYEDEKSDYLTNLNTIFCYKYFEQEDSDILSFNIPYLKQNTNMGIPSLLYFKNTPDYIQYEIRSKHFPDVVAGKLIIKEY